MTINIIVSTVVILVGICLLSRLLRMAGVDFGHSWSINPGQLYAVRKLFFSENVLAEKNSYKPSRRDVAKIALAAALIRLVVYAVSIIIMRIYLDTEMLTVGDFFTEWRKWDANNYLRIATLGYSGYVESGRYTTLVFFPLYSWLIKLVMMVIRDADVSAMVVSCACYIVGCCFLYVTVSKEYGRKVAEKTIVYLSVFPFSFFFGSMMPESTFFMLICMCFYFLKEKKWALVTIVGIFASLSRMQGVLLMIPAAIEWVSYRKPVSLIKNKKHKEFWGYFIKEFMMIPFMIIGSVIYLIINYSVSGDAFIFLKYQKAIWGQEAQWFGKTVSDLWTRSFIDKNVGFTRVTLWMPQLIIFFVFLFIIVYGIGKVHDKYIIFLLAYLIMNYLPTWLLSAGRYMTVAVPAFIILAIFSERNKWSDRWIVGINVMLFTIYLFGFLTWKQIM